MTVFVTGATGLGTGPHLDFRVYNPATGGYEDPSSYTSYLTVGDDQSPFDFQVTSGFQPGGRVHPVTGKVKPHPGIDYGTPEGTRLNVNGQLLSTWEDIRPLFLQTLVQLHPLLPPELQFGLF